MEVQVEKRVIKTGIYLVELGELCILVFNGRTGSLVKGHLDESGGDVETEELSLLSRAQRSIHHKKCEVLWKVATMFRHLKNRYLIIPSSTFCHVGRQLG